MPRPTNLFGNTPEQLVATFRGALLPHPSPTQPTRTTPSTGKKRFNTHRHRLAQFNEFYRQCPPPPFQCLHSFALVGTPDRMLFTNSYFDSLSARDGHIMIAHPGCVRLENGVLTTQRDAPANLPANTAGIFNGKTDCMNEGAMTNIFAVVARRFPVVDEEAGTVLGLGVFLRKPGVAMRRNQFSEWFVIDQGKLRGIYSSMFYPDQDTLAPNWPPYDGNWPVLPAPK